MRANTDPRCSLLCPKRNQRTFGFVQRFKEIIIVTVFLKGDV